jgi:copper resistance protein C
MLSPFRAPTRALFTVAGNRRGRCTYSTQAHVMRSFRFAFIAALVAAMALAGPPVASAHAARIAADPAENTALAAGPQRVSATFNEQMQPEFAAMTVVGPDSNLWSIGDPVVTGAVLSVGVRPLGPAGTYTVNYRVTSADGHPVSGSWTFQLTVAATGAPGPSAARSAEPAGGGGIPVWPFLVAGAAIIGGGILWTARRRT